MSDSMLPEKRPPLSFRKPRDTSWLEIEAQEDDKDQQEKCRRNREELNNFLLGSLQMQNLVVLAGSGASLSAGGPSMKDLWRVVVRSELKDEVAPIAETIGYELGEKNIESFLSRIEAYLQIKEDASVQMFLTTSKKLILEACSSFIEEEKLEAHQTFVHRLSRRRARDRRLQIYTTNYDLCFEQAASSLSTVVIDGFSFTTPRKYDPRYYDLDIVRRPRNGDTSNFLEGVFQLQKLHGSVNWARTEDGGVIERFDPEPTEACLIYPASGKYQQSFTQPYLETISNFLSTLREPNTCLITVGFGFNDSHLAEPILASARSNPHFRLVITDPAATTLSEGGTRYWDQFSKLSERGEDIWFINEYFDGFAGIIPDLKALTPAESLAKAVGGVVKDL